MKTEPDDVAFPTDEPPSAPAPAVNGTHPGESFETARRVPAPKPAGRQLPHSLEAEAGLLSAVLLDDGLTLDRCIAQRLTPGAFYDPKHSIAYEHLLGMKTKGLPIEAATLAEELSTSKQLEQVGGYGFILQISSAAPTTALAQYHLQKVTELATLRELIRTATAAVEDCYGYTGDLPALTADLRRRFEAAAVPAHTPEPQLVGRPLTSFLVPADDDRSTLLGHRFLCRGDGMVIVSASGMGKSSLSLQSAAVWALGKPFMGIQPNGPLKSLVIQAEDSDGDIGEVWASICHRLELTPAELRVLTERVIVVTNRIHRGPKFLAELERQIAVHKPDLVWINPLASYMTGDGTTQEAVGDFLRAGLNGINAKCEFAYILIQHTTKPQTGKDRSSQRQWHEIQYDMAGSYDIIGWARAIISLRPTENLGEFNMVLAKRGRRAGVTKRVPHGVGYRLESTIIIPVRHTSGRTPIPELNKEIPTIFWEAREEEAPSTPVPDKSMGRPKKNDIKDFIHLFPESPSSAIGINELLREALKTKSISKPTLYSVIDDGLAQGLIVCNSSNPKAPCYFKKPQIVKPVSPDLDL